MALLLGTLAVLWLLAPVLTPFVVAAILAYALTPVVDWLDRLGRGRMPRWVHLNGWLGRTVFVRASAVGQFGTGDL